MRTLVVDHRDVLLSHQAGTLCIRDGQQVLQRLPLAQIDRLVIESDARLSANLLRQMAAAGIGVVITRGRSRASAVLMAPPMGDAGRRLRQMQAWLDPAQRQGWAADVVRMRLAGQLAALRAWVAQVPGERYRLLRAARALRRLRARIASAPGIPALRGLEGVAARIHFAALRLLLPAELGFEGRHRRPPTDPVNAALSLGYTLLHARVLDAIHRAGLDAGIGALHGLAYGRAGLACDLVEGERARIERLVVSLFRSRRLEASQFGQSGPACILAKAGRGPFFAALEPELRRSERRTGRRIARLLRRLPELPE